MTGHKCVYILYTRGANGTNPTINTYYFSALAMCSWASFIFWAMVLIQQPLTCSVYIKIRSIWRHRTTGLLWCFLLTSDDAFVHFRVATDALHFPASRFAIGSFTVQLGNCSWQQPNWDFSSLEGAGGSYDDVGIILVKIPITFCT